MISLSDSGDLWKRPKRIGIVKASTGSAGGLGLERNKPTGWVSVPATHLTNSSFMSERRRMISRDRTVGRPSWIVVLSAMFMLLK